MTERVANDVSELALALAAATSASGGGSAVDAARDGIGKMLTSAIETANLKVVQSVYAKEVRRSGFERPFAE